VLEESRHILAAVEPDVVGRAARPQAERLARRREEIEDVLSR
jgi:hypothetical protein